MQTRINGEIEAGLWAEIVREAQASAAESGYMARYLGERILSKRSFQESLTHVLAFKLGNEEFEAQGFLDLIGGVIADNRAILESTCADIMASRTRNPACTSVVQPFLFFKGFQALQCYRIAHELWGKGKPNTALLLQSRIAEKFCVDIHPAAVIKRGVFIDHANGLVVGETAVVEDDVSILHEVTLGGTGKMRGNRHPKIRRGVLLCAGAKVLGKLEVGEGAKVGACSVVLHDVPPYSTVAGIPARVVSFSARSAASEMNQSLEDNNDKKAAVKPVSNSKIW